MKPAKNLQPRKTIRAIVPYILLFGVVFVTLMVGFVFGRVTASSEAIDDPTPNTTEVTTTVSDAPTTTTTAAVEWIEFVATAYCPCEKCCGVWATKRPLDENGEQIVYGATGIVLQQGVSVAADTSRYPMGTELEIENLGIYTVQDRGGAIKGNRLDVYFDNHEDALKFGRQAVRVRVVK